MKFAALEYYKDKKRWRLYPCNCYIAIICKMTAHKNWDMKTPFVVSGNSVVMLSLGFSPACIVRWWLLQVLDILFLRTQCTESFIELHFNGSQLRLFRAPLLAYPNIDLGSICMSLSFICVKKSTAFVFAQWEKTRLSYALNIPSST